MPLAEVGALATTMARQRKQFKGMAHAIIAINRLGPTMSSRVCILPVYTSCPRCQQCASILAANSDNIAQPLRSDGPAQIRSLGCYSSDNVTAWIQSPREGRNGKGALDGVAVPFERLWMLRVCKSCALSLQDVGAFTHSSMQREEVSLSEKKDIPEIGEVVPMLDVQDKSASTRNQGDSEALTDNNAADESGLVPAGVLGPSSQDHSAQNTQEDSPHVLQAFDESSDLRAKSPVAVVDV